MAVNCTGLTGQPQGPLDKELVHLARATVMQGYSEKCSRRKYGRVVEEYSEEWLWGAC